MNNFLALECYCVNTKNFTLQCFGFCYVEVSTKMKVLLCIADVQTIVSNLHVNSRICGQLM